MCLMLIDMLYNVKFSRFLPIVIQDKNVNKKILDTTVILLKFVHSVEILALN